MKVEPLYAALPHVADFIEWLAGELDSRTLFQHQYLNRRSGKHWQCDSLFGAYQAYAWNHPGNARLGFNPGVSAASNARALEALRQDLLVAGGDDDRVLQAALDVMAWGGVTAGNAEWLRTHRTGLAHMIQEVREALIAGDPDAPVLRSRSLRFNSGMTKIYSLICPDFIIYDSRVAAALGMIVVRYCEAKGLEEVPEALRFPWAAAKEDERARLPKRRNPSSGTLRFKRLRSGRHHALWNLRASWVLSRVLAHPLAADSPFQALVAPEQPLRALEQALFMIGYDLGPDEALEYSPEVAAQVLAAMAGPMEETTFEEFEKELLVLKEELSREERQKP